MATTKHSEAVRGMATRTDTPDGITHMEDVVRNPVARWALVALRYVLGFTFLWPFLDKLFGLGYGTPAENARRSRRSR